MQLCSSSELSYDKLSRFTQLVNDERVNVNAIRDDKRGWTPLLRIIYKNYEHEKLIKMVSLLIGIGADPSIKAPDGDNILHYYVQILSSRQPDSPDDSTCNRQTRG